MHQEGEKEEEMELPYPENFDSKIIPNLNLRGDSELQLLSGEIDITRSEYLRNFNLLEGFTEQGGSAYIGAGAAESSIQYRVPIQ